MTDSLDGPTQDPLSSMTPDGRHGSQRLSDVLTSSSARSKLLRGIVTSAFALTGIWMYVPDGDYVALVWLLPLLAAGAYEVIHGFRLARINRHLPVGGRQEPTSRESSIGPRKVTGSPMSPYARTPTVGEVMELREKGHQRGIDLRVVRRALKHELSLSWHKVTIWCCRAALLWTLVLLGARGWQMNDSWWSDPVVLIGFTASWLYLVIASNRAKRLTLATYVLVMGLRKEDRQWIAALDSPNSWRNTVVRLHDFHWIDQFMTPNTA